MSELSLTPRRQSLRHQSPLRQTVRRLGVAAIGATTLLATPYLATTPAFAGTPTLGTPPAITLTSQSQTGSPIPVSTRSDGTNTTITIAANTAVTAPNDPTYPPVVAVRFTYQTGSTAGGAGGALGPSVLISTDTTAPWTTEWTPPGPGTYTETAETLNAAGSPVTSTSKTVQVDNVSSAVRITSPASGAPIGVNAGSILVAGTRSADLPTLSVSVQTRDNSTGALTPGTATTVPAGNPTGFPLSPNTWSTLVTAPACPAGAGSCDVFVTAVAGTSATAPGWSDDSTRATLYAQSLGAVSITPGVTSAATRTTKSFLATLTDQNGQPMVGPSLSITASAGSNATTTPTLGTATTMTAAQTTTTATATTTVAAATLPFTATDPLPETTTLTVATGSTATDVRGTATFTTTANPPMTATIKTLQPQKALYAVSNTYSAATSEYNAATAIGSTTGPVVDICLTDASGNTLDANATNLAKIVPTITRTSTIGAPVVTSPILLSDQAANPGCFLMPHDAAAGGTEYEGNDVFSAYVNNDGAPGYQAGGTDIQAAAITLHWGVVYLNQTRLTKQRGTTITVPLATRTLNGTPFAGRGNMQIIATDAILPTLQPSGTTQLTATTASCTTDIQGICKVTLTLTNASASMPNVTIFDSATDPLDASQIPTGNNGTLSFYLLDVPVKMASFGSSARVSKPTVNNTPVGSAAGTIVRPGDVVRPGDIPVHTLSAFTAFYNTIPLYGVRLTLTLDRGYFTSCPSITSNCWGSPAMSNNTVIGAPVNLGKTITTQANNLGRTTFATSIGRDEQFDVNGSVTQRLTATDEDGTSFTNDLVTFTTAQTALTNASTKALSLVPATSSDVLSGNAAANVSEGGQGPVTVNTGTNFAARITDQFGNLVQLAPVNGTCPVSLAISGGGYFGPAGGPGTTSQAACGSFTGAPSEVFHVDSNATSTTGILSTVTATWNAPVTMFQAVTPAPTPPTFTIVAGAPVPQSATFNINLYAIDRRALNVTVSMAPAASTVPTDTPVTATLTVTDQKGAPLRGLRVTAERTGPLTPTGADDQYRTTATYSDVRGATSFTYTSPNAGQASVNLTMLDSTGNPLTRTALLTTFTSNANPAPSPTASPTPSPTASPTPSPTASPTVSPTPDGPVTISGNRWRTPAYRSAFTITGTAPAGATVTVHFHRAGTPANDYSTTRTTTADATGTWRQPITASADYRYYATVGATGTSRSATVHAQPDGALDGAPTRIVPVRQSYTLTGTGVPGSTLYLHFHAIHTPAGDYSIVRPVTVNANGTWSRPYLAHRDYRLYTSRSATDSATFTTYLIQAR